jgi:two-component system, chemotaxis family, chemotaxis protein CheY
MHLLVADDEPISRQLLGHILRDSGQHEVTLAADGLEAWMRLKEAPATYDLVILDIMMPRMDGWTLLRRMREDAALRSTPVMLCTSTGDRSTVVQAAALRVEHFIVKPYSRAVILEKLNLLASNREETASLEQTAVVCARLGLEEATYRRLLGQLLQDVSVWVSEAVPRARQDIGAVILAANGLRGAALGLGARGLARAFLDAEARLREVEEITARINLALLPSEVDQVAQGVAAEFKRLRQRIEG